MRINMWMIAYLLEKNGMDVTTDIHCEHVYEIFGVGLTEAPGRVGLSSRGEDVLCAYSGSFILCRQQTLMDVLNGIQDVLNFYNEWSEKIAALCRAGNWQGVLDEMSPVFPKALLIFDSNQTVVAMSSQYGKGTVNEEWDFLMDYRYPSNGAFRFSRSRPHFFEILLSGSGIFYGPSTPSRQDESVTVTIRSNNVVLGFLTSTVVRDRYTTGEIDTLHCLAGLIAANFPTRSEAISAEFSENVFRKYLTDPNANDAFNLNRLTSSYNWNPASLFRTVNVHFDQDVLEDKDRMFAIAVNILNIPCISFPDSIVFILCCESPSYDLWIKQLKLLATDFSVTLAGSLALRNIRNIFYGMEQTEFVIQSRRAAAPGTLLSFYDCAVDFMISHSNLKSLFFACKRELVELYAAGEHSAEFAATLESYLLQERSLQKASRSLHLHKNTIAYRIQKLTENAAIRLDDTYDREYIKLSFMVIRYLQSPRCGSIFSELLRDLPDESGKL